MRILIFKFFQIDKLIWYKARTEWTDSGLNEFDFILDENKYIGSEFKVI